MGKSKVSFIVVALGLARRLKAQRRVSFGRITLPLINSAPSPSRGRFIRAFRDYEGHAYHKQGEYDEILYEATFYVYSPNFEIYDEAGMVYQVRGRMPTSCRQMTYSRCQDRNSLSDSDSDMWQLFFWLTVLAAKQWRPFRALPVS